MSTDAKPSIVRELYVQAVRIREDAARQAYLDEACGSQIELRQRVEQLLAAALRSERDNVLQLATSDSMSGRSPLPWTGDDSNMTIDSHSDAMGDNRTRGDAMRGQIDVSTHPMIGRYKLLEELGHGGMGTVYMAQQTEPVRRKVALKIIKPGMDSNEVVARFEAERQALAMMDHPNVAKVLDGGTTESGRPFFVMELVHGTPLTNFCDENRLSNQRRLELFVDVCRAIQHAHLKGIIHRDLKPSNVLVTMDDDRPLPKVIDFGISKALSQSLTDKTMFTAFGQMVGTPLYMSPEQAQLNANDIDVRSDVYSLGVLLYEILTGNTPFDRDTLERSGFDEMRRLIREVDPPCPSARVSTLQAEMISTVSEQRRADPRRLSSSLAGELDWIVMKALEKERARRYESARDLAADIQRHLSDEPVEARPPSIRYRLGKFTRRHRVALTTVGLIAASLIVGLSVAVWQAFVISQERDRAIAAEKRAEREAAISAAVNNFLNEDLLAQASPLNQPDPDVTLRSVLDAAAGKVELQFADQPLVEAEIRHALATTYWSLGEYEEAKKHADRSAALRKNNLGADAAATIESERLIADILYARGDYADSRMTLEKLLSRASRALGRDAPVTLKTMHSLAATLHQQGELEAAEKLNRQTHKIRRRVLGETDRDTLESTTRLAEDLRLQEKFIESEKLHREALRMKQETLGEEHESTLRSLNYLAILCRHVGRGAEAEALHREVVKGFNKTHGAEHPATLRAKYQLSVDMGEIGRYDEAETLALDVLESQRRILGEHHPSTLASLLGVGNASFKAGREEKAAEFYGEALAGYRQSRGETHADTLVCMNNLTYVLNRLGKGTEAENLYQSLIKKCRETLGVAHSRTLLVMRGLAGIYREQGKTDEAERLLRQVVESARDKLGSEHSSTRAATHALGNLYIELRRFEEAAKLLQELVDVEVRTLGEDHPDTLTSLSSLASLHREQRALRKSAEIQGEVVETTRRLLGDRHPVTLNHIQILASVHTEQQRFEEASALYREAFAGQQAVFGEEHRETLTTALDLSWMLHRQKKFGEAEELIEKNIDACRRTFGETHPKTLYVRNLLGMVYYDQGRHEESLAELRKALEGRKRVLGHHPDTAITMKYLGLVCWELEAFDEAESVYREFIEVAPKFFDEDVSDLIKARDRLARIYAEQQRYEDQEKQLRENIAYFRRVHGNKHRATIDSQQQLASALLRRTESLVVSENYNEALDVLSEITEFSPDHEQAESLVALQLYLKKQEATAVFSQQLWQLAQAETGDEFQKARWIVDALLSPHHGLDVKEIVEFCRPLIKAKNGHYLRLALGLALYRQGDFKHAAETIATSDQGTPWIRPLVCYFSAMAHHRIGDTERARELFDLAVERRNRMASTPTEGAELQSFEPARWALWCIYQGVEREAAEVLEIQSSKQLAESDSEK